MQRSQGMGRVEREMQVDLFISFLKIERCVLSTRSRHFREAEEGGVIRCRARIKVGGGCSLGLLQLQALCSLC